jgi:uncharacterized protein
VLLLLLIQLGLAIEVHQVPNPREASGWVTDMQDVLTPEAEAEANSISESLYRDLTVEVAVVTIDDCKGTPKAFATELFNHWGIGNAASNNGLLVLLVMDQRRLEMESGDGLKHVLTDTSLKAIQEDVMVPNFKRGDFGAGLLAGLKYVDEELRRQSKAARTGNRSAAAPAADAIRTPATPAPRADIGQPEPLTLMETGIVATIFALIVGIPALGLAGLTALGFGAIYWLVRAIRRSRGRYCKACGINRHKLSEVADDEHLTDGQQHEEHIRSVNYNVYVCPTCQSTGIVRYGRWFSGYSRCPQCSNVAMTTSSRTLQQAT